MKWQTPDRSTITYWRKKSTRSKRSWKRNGKSEKSNKCNNNNGKLRNSNSSCNSQVETLKSGQ